MITRPGSGFPYFFAALPPGFLSFRVPDEPRNVRDRFSMLQLGKAQDGKTAEFFVPL